MSQFWQNTQRRLHQVKKIVPEALLLAVMRAETRYHGPLARAAHRAVHRLPAVDAAVAGAEVAVTQMPVGRLDARRQIACAKQLQVGRVETVALQRGIHGLSISPATAT